MFITFVLTTRPKNIKAILLLHSQSLGEASGLVDGNQ